MMSYNIIIIIIGGNIMRIIKKSIAAVLCAALVISLAPASAGAAKKPSIKKKVSVAVDATTTIKVKKAAKKAKVAWKTSDKKVVKITKKVTKGKKASVTIKGVKEGTAKITATYKLGKKKTKLTSKVTVTPASSVVIPTSGTATQVPTSGTATQAPSAVPTVKPTKGPTNTPRPSATPSPAPVNDGATARQLPDGKVITVDGIKADGEYEDADGSFDLLANVMSVRGETTITAATATLMWKADALYALVEVKGGDAANDKVILYTADGDKVVMGEATIAAAEGGYVAEATVALKDAAVDGTAKFEIQINNGDATINYFDSITAIEYDKEADKWNFKDNGVKAAEDTSVYGTVTFVKAMEQPTVAYYTDKGADIRTAADLDNAVWDNEPAEGEDAPAVKAKKMKFVDTAFWTDVYTAAGSDSINFANGNIPEYKGNAAEVTLAEVQEDETLKTDRKYAQAYTIWDEDYLYVLYDIKDPDIAPATVDFFDTDSVEFFLDEDYSRPTSYGTGDEVQLRVGADNAFSSNESGTGQLELVAHAVNVSDTGYQVEMIIKFVSKHAEGDMMGMDLQINDCFTTETVAEDGTTTYGADRACTLTAYDTTNNGYQDPSCFGRIKLVK